MNIFLYLSTIIFLSVISKKASGVELDSCQRAMVRVQEILQEQSQFELTERKFDPKLPENSELIFELWGIYAENNKILLTLPSQSEEFQRLESEQKQIRELIIISYWRIIYILEKYPGFQRLDPWELMSIAAEAIITSSQKFNHQLTGGKVGNFIQYSTYLYRPLSSALRIYLAAYQSLNPRVYDRILKYQATYGLLLREFKRPPTTIEMIQALRWSADVTESVGIGFKKKNLGYG